MEENGQGTRRVNVDNYIGKTLDKYILTESLGRGGMGLVFKAEQKRIKRFVAIKILPPARLDQVSIKRLEREATAMGNMKHPHIATLYDFGISDENQPYLVMELIEGRSLKQILKESGGMVEPDRAVAILIQIADAMEYAHVNGVIHRDLKPDNVMLSDNVHADYVKVLDFGIAKSLDASVSLTKTGQMVGSPVYMSPEQCTGRSVPDHRSDIYSLGALLYECLTGVIPLRGDTYLETVYRKTNDTADPFPAHLDDCKALEELVFRCLQVDPAKRPQSMQEVRAELMRFAGTRSGIFDGTKAAFDALQASGNQRTAASQMTTATITAPNTLIIEQPQSAEKDASWRPTRHDLQLPLALTMASMFIVTVTAGSLMVALKTSMPGFEPPAPKAVPNQRGSMDDVMTHGLAPVPVKTPPPPKVDNSAGNAANSTTGNTTDNTAPGAAANSTINNQNSIDKKSVKEPLPAPQRATRSSTSRPKTKSSRPRSSVPVTYTESDVPYAPSRSYAQSHSYEASSNTMPDYSSNAAPPKKGSKLGHKTKKFLKKIRNTIDQVIRD